MLEGACLCGAVRWTFDGDPVSATICNCTACRRYGVLWAYDFEGGLIAITGTTKFYQRREGSALEFHFCPDCGCVSHWRATRLEEDGGRRIAVNLRLAEPDTVAGLVLDIFDGLDTFEDLPRDGRCIRNVWS
jgi:hypothetical protein